MAIGISALLGIQVLVAGYAEKSRCLDPATATWSLGRSCYSDIPSLYTKRGFDQPGVVPYLEGDGNIHTPDGDIEYPPGTGAVVAGALAVSDDVGGFFRANAFILTGFAMLAFAALAAMTTQPWRLIAILVLPTLYLYAFINWDIHAAATVVLAIWAASRDRHLLAGGLLGLGAAFKVFPGVLVPLVAAHAWSRNRRLPFGPVVASIVVFLAFNVPIWLVARDSFWGIWRFHGRRPPSPESPWYLIAEAVGQPGGLGVASTRLSLLVAAAAVIAIALFELRRARRRPFQLAATCLAALAIWVAVGKIFSPQATLWFLPLFAIVRIPKTLLLAFGASELWTLIAHTGWYRVMSTTGNADAWWPELRISILARSVVLLLIVVAALRGGDLIRGRGGASTDGADDLAADAEPSARMPNDAHV